MTQSIHLIGAGLAGSLLAVYLARRGFDVEVFERRPDMRKEEIPAGRSINLALANRGLRALDGVGLEREVRRLLIPMRGRMLHDVDGELMLQPYGQHESEVIYSVSRGGLNELLMSTAEAMPNVSLHFNHRCEDIDFETGDMRILDKERGELRAVSGAPVICADGAGSRIRRAMVERFGIACTEDYLAHDYKELNIPPGDAGAHLMEPHALHIWPRGDYMLIALPNLDGSFTVTLFLAKEGKDSFAALRSDADVEAFFRRDFPDILPLLPDLIANFNANPTGYMVTVRCDRWHVGGSVLLLGDAAHAIVPFHGQGMNAAFEDCADFDECIEQHGTDWPDVFAAFETRRKANTDAIADMALENYVEMRETVRDPLFHLQKSLAWELEQRHPGVFIPRYSMVMFHHMPYADAQRRGAVQKDILTQLTTGAKSLNDVDFDEAERLVKTRLRPMLEA